VKRGVDRANLRQIPLDHDGLDSLTDTKTPGLKICLQNARSVRNKTLAINDLIVDKHIDLLAITESWLKDDGTDNEKISKIKPEGYLFEQVPRTGSRGGGIAILYKDGLKITIVSPHIETTSFENMECTLDIKDQSPLHIIIIYRPPPSEKNKFTYQMFHNEFSEFLDAQVLSRGRLLLIGDFNIHVDNPTGENVSNFLNLIHSTGLEQHVTKPTHKDGHTLDLCITPNESTYLKDISVDNLDISDHYSVFIHLSLLKGTHQKHTVTYRKMKAIDVSKFTKDIETSLLTSTHNQLPLMEMISQYNNELHRILDEHAPQKSKSVIQRPNTDWYDDELRAAKQKQRQYERKWRKTRLTIHLEMFREQKRLVHTMVEHAKITHYNTLISEHSSDSKKLFQTINKLLGDERCMKLPKHISLQGLVERFSCFFKEKIEKIRATLGTSEPDTCRHPPATTLSKFTPVTEAEVKKLIAASPSKSCTLDPIPTWLLKMCIEPLAPFVTRIINTSLINGTVPVDFKKALVTPLLKKPTLDADVLKNYRPVSNLPFISKVLEKVVASQLKSFLAENGIMEPFQSAYRKDHSTETALVRVQNDILRSMDKGEAVLLVLLDLSAAFDTIDHKRLLFILEHEVGLVGSALAWVKSYLEGRGQIVHVNGTSSSKQQLLYGVPQGSVLGPLLYTVYTIPLGHLLRELKVHYHFYADDTQLLSTFRPGKAGDLEQAATNMEGCVNMVRTWMAKNLLKMNDDKTEFIVFSSKQSAHKFQSPELHIGDAIVSPTDKVRNIGAIMDKHMTMEKQVNHMCRCAFLQIRRLNSISFVTSRLDMNNGLLYGLPSTLLNKLQRVQNVAARIITKTPRQQHITPVLKSLHWLPVPQRAKFKVILLVFKGKRGLAPSYIEDLLIDHKATRSLRSMDKNLLHVPRTKTLLGDRAFSVAGPRLWNALPQEMRNITSIDTFKQCLKTHLFKEHYEC
jgi:exonuclease III